MPGSVERVSERQHALRLFALLAIPLSLVVLVPLVVGFVAYRHQTQAQIQRVAEERIARSRAINQFIFEQCVKDEIRDVVITDQLRAAQARARATLPPGPLLDAQLQTLQDGIVVLEPPDEGDCRPPPVTVPK